MIGEFGISDPRDGELALIQRGGYKTVKEAADYIIRLRENSKYDPQLLIFKKSDKEKTLVGLQAAADKLSTIASDWTEENLQEILESVVADNNLSNGDVFWPIRVALSGEEKSPSPIELLLALGKDESIKRITKAIHKSG